MAKRGRGKGGRRAGRKRRQERKRQRHEVVQNESQTTGGGRMAAGGKDDERLMRTAVIAAVHGREGGQQGIVARWTRYWKRREEQHDKLFHQVPYLDAIFNDERPTATVLRSAPEDTKPEDTNKHWPPLGYDQESERVVSVDEALLEMERELAAARAAEDVEWEKLLREGMSVQGMPLAAVAAGPNTRAPIHTVRLRNWLLVNAAIIGCFIGGIWVVERAHKQKLVGTVTTAGIVDTGIGLVCGYSGLECSPDQSGMSAWLHTEEVKPDKARVRQVGSDELLVLRSLLVNKGDVLEHRDLRRYHGRKQGNNKAAIIALQKLLHTSLVQEDSVSGCDAHMHTGQYDWQTRCEVRAFQRWAKHHGYPKLRVDSAVGPETVRVIAHVLQET